MIFGLLDRLRGRRGERVCYLHVGPHKTGSTSIQHVLQSNAGRLRRSGVLYPTLAKRDGRQSRMHSRLTRSGNFAEGGRLVVTPDAWGAVERALGAGAPTVLLSSELFANCFGCPGRLASVVDLIEAKGYRAEAIAYVRDQPGWLNSWFIQTRKRLRRETDFDAFVAHADARGLVDPWAIVGSILAEPRVRLQVASFERATTAGLEHDFLRRIGVPRPQAYPAAKHANRNAGAKTVYAAGEIMRRSPERVADLTHYDVVNATFRATFERLGWQDTPHVALDDARYRAIRARYAERNERFAQRFFECSWADLAPERDVSPSVYDPQTATQAERSEVEAVIEGMLELIRRPEVRRTSMRREPLPFAARASG